ncbi:MAG: reverse transcriptase domain-containing protein [Eubacteriales bacterium]|nr:reverse transcriptase domain-containing protein [Eubacteriales bacterium]
MRKRKLETHKSKRAGFLYEKICDLDNIKAAILNASKKKRRQKNVRRILDNIDYYAHQIQMMLQNMTYHPSKYVTKLINDGIRQKKRNIAKPRFYPDQCIHHALIQGIEPVLMKGMYHYCCGSVKGRGDKRIRKAVKKWLKRNPKKSKYVLKMDVHHFYESIDHDELKKVLAKKIKDKRVLWLCGVIIDSCPKGIPIGNYTSQWFCNLFLEDLDHKIKAFLGKDYIYVRYIDDMVIIGPNKRKLHQARKMIEEELQGKKLQMKGNYQVFRLRRSPFEKHKGRPLDFLGCKFHKDETLTIRKSILKRIKRKARRIEWLANHHYISARNAAGMMSYMGRIHQTNSEHLFRDEIKPRIGSTKRLRRIISDEAKIQRATAGDVAGSAA